MIAYAATVENLTDVISIAIGLLNSLIPLIIGLALVIFLWGVVRYVVAGADKEGKEKGRRFMIWGIIGLVVMVSVWGIVSLVRNTLFEGVPSPAGDGGNPTPNTLGDPNFTDDPNFDPTDPVFPPAL